MDFANLKDAYTWAWDLVDRTAKARGWTDEIRDLGLSLVQTAYERVKEETSINFAWTWWKLLDQTGPEFFDYLADSWSVIPGAPDGWAELAGVWFEATGAAKSAESQDWAAAQALADGLTETGKDLGDAARTTFNILPWAVGAGVIIFLARS